MKTRRMTRSNAFALGLSLGMLVVFPYTGCKTQAEQTALGRDIKDVTSAVICVLTHKSEDPDRVAVDCSNLYPLLAQDVVDTRAAYRAAKGKDGGSDAP